MAVELTNLTILTDGQVDLMPIMDWIVFQFWNWENRVLKTWLRNGEEVEIA